MHKYIILLVFLAFNLGYVNAATDTNIFNYQGTLKMNELPVTGQYDFYVEIFSDKSSGNYLTEISIKHVKVIDGTFNLNLNFDSIDFSMDNLWMETSIKLTTDTKSLTQLLPRQKIPANDSVGSQYSYLRMSSRNKSTLNQISLDTLKFEKITNKSINPVNSTALNKQQVEFAAQHLPPIYDQSLKKILKEHEYNKISHVHGVLRSIINADLKGEIFGNLIDFEIAKNHRLVDSYTVVEDKILIDITTTSDPTDTVNSLKKIPGVKINAVASTPAYSAISVFATAKSLLQMCLIPSLKSAIPVVVISDKLPEKSLNNSLNQKSYATKSQGTASNQAEDALEVVALRRIFSGITGTGISVGVMSDSIGLVGNGISDSQATNDLPDSSVINVLNDAPSGVDEGRAMMELIYDISPGLDTYGYATATTGAANMANNITALANAGMDIIVDDIIYFGEPNFQDGVIDQSIQTFVSQGGSYFTAAGNRANQSYESAYTDFFGYHNYGGSGLGDAFMQVTIPAGATIRVYLQWAEPWGNATSDFDLELWDGTVQNLLRTGSVNNIGGNSFESIVYRNILATAFTANIAVKRVSGSNPVFKFIISGPITFDQFSNGATGTMKPYSRYGIATGAAPWFNRDVAEPFSSLGPLTRHFDAQGNPISKLTLNKPDFMSIDAGNTSFFGIDSTQDGDTLPNFFGTSAAAPNAAAVAALMLQVAGGSGSLNQNQIKDLMNKSAIDLGAANFDTTYGNGRINALGAVMLARGPQLPKNHMYLNQNGDATLNKNLFSINDVSSIMYSSNDIGNTTIDVIESDIELDPMMAVFLPDFDFAQGVAYDGGAGDDARIDFFNGANFPYLFEVFSETMFTGVTAFTAIINAPNQQVTTRTANLNIDGEDFNIFANISTRGHAEYYQYTAPLSGNLDINLRTNGFDGNLRIYNNAGDLLGSTTSNSGINKLINIQNIVQDENYFIQVVPNLYIGTGSFNLSVDFNKNMFTLFAFTKGTGTGLLHSGITPGINCGSNCQADYEEGVTLTLTAAPSSGHTFVGWSGSPCVETGNTCFVTMDTAKLITAEFMAPDEMFKNGFE